MIPGLSPLSSGRLDETLPSTSIAYAWMNCKVMIVYLSHRNLGYSTLFWLHDQGVAISTSFLIALADALILAVALTYAVERPAMRALRRRYRLPTNATLTTP